jgi:hypothetical protein
MLCFAMYATILLPLEPFAWRHRSIFLTLPGGLDQRSVSGDALEKVGIADGFRCAGGLFEEGTEFLVELLG